MGISAFNFRHHLRDPHVDLPDRTQYSAKPFFDDFRVCPHCERKGRPSVVESLNKSGAVISRSDGESFHLVLGDQPIEFPTNRSSGKPAIMTAGFWYISEREGADQAFTKTVVVTMRTHLRGVRLVNRLERVADLLAERLAGAGQLETYYDFSRNHLHQGF